MRPIAWPRRPRFRSLDGVPPRPVQMAHMDVPPAIEGVRVGIVGAGQMAWQYGSVIGGLDGAWLAGCVSRSHTSAERLIRQQGSGEAFRSVDAMVSSGVDAVIVAVPIDQTASMTERVLTLGVPVLVEKPAGRSLDESLHLAAVARSTGVISMVGLNRRYYSVVLAALQTVRSRGPIRGVIVEAHEPLRALRRGGRLPQDTYDRWIVANSVHFVDLLRLVGGDVVSCDVQASAVEERHGDHISASVRFESGAIGTFVAHWNSVPRTALRIFGDGVRADLEPLEEGFITFADGRRIRLRPAPYDLAHKQGLFAQTAAFLSAASSRHPVPPPASDLEDSVRTMQLVDTITRAVVPNRAARVTRKRSVT